MPALLRPLTYTRWLHLVIASVAGAVFAFVVPGIGNLGGWHGAWLLLVPLPFVGAAALIPGVRLSEGMQARLLLFPGPGARDDREVAAAPSGSWGDRRRTALWLVLRYEASMLTAFLSVHLLTLAADLLLSSGGRPLGKAPLLWPPGAHEWYTLPAPLPVVLLLAFTVAAGTLTATAAGQLLGPSAAERITALEERTELLLEHTTGWPGSSTTPSDTP